MDFEIHEQTVPLESQDYTLERNKPMPSYNHGKIQANIIMELAAFRKKYDITSETTLSIDKWPRVPDVTIFPSSVIDLWNDQISVKSAPLCAIEILSPTQSLTELTTKAKEYFGHGVQSCWIVLPSLASIYVYSSPIDYAIFRANETLVDKKLNVSFSLEDVFK